MFVHEFSTYFKLALNGIRRIVVSFTIKNREKECLYMNSQHLKLAWNGIRQILVSFTITNREKECLTETYFYFFFIDKSVSY